jgi:hypothetical protein
MTDVNDNLEPIAEAPKKPPMMKKKAAKKKAKKPNYNLSAPLKANQVLKPGYNAPVDPSTVVVPKNVLAKWLGDPKKVAEVKELAAQIAALKKQIEDAKRKEEALLNKQKKLKPVIDETTLKYLKLVEKECSQFITAAKNAKNFLYRGIEDSKYEAFVGKPFSNRRPLDSSEDFQEKIDNALIAMGFKALRRNSIFTSGDISQASDYGDGVFLIFPKNGFNFTWSTSVRDLHSEYDEYDDDDNALDNFLEFAVDIMADIGDVLMDFKEFNNEYEDVSDAMQLKMKKISNSPQFKTTYTKIKNAASYNYSTLPKIKAAIEAFIALEKAAGIKFKIDRYNLSDVIKDYKKVSAPKNDKSNAAKIVKDFKLTNTNIVSAIKSGHEIYIFGEYIALSLEKYGQVASSYFLGKVISDIRNFTEYY